jgi:hypothetical protein
MTVKPNPTQPDRRPRRITQRVSSRRAIERVWRFHRADHSVCVHVIASPYLRPKNIFNAAGMLRSRLYDRRNDGAGGWWMDLSVGAVLAVGAMVTARTMTYYGFHPWIAFGGLLSP